MRQVWDGLHPFIDILQDARRASGISQVQLSERCGIERHSLRNYELGEKFPNIHKLFRWAEALGYEIIIRKKP